MIKYIATYGLLLTAFTLPLHAGAETKHHFTSDEAINIALEVQAGTVVEAELDEFEGRAVYDIEIVNEAGEEIEFKVDVETGEILNQWTDDDPTDDPESGTDYGDASE